MVFKKDKILTIFYIHDFIIALIFILYILILYFNITAYMNALKNKDIDILPDNNGCNYTDLNVIPDKNKCTKINKFYTTINNLTYTLSTNDSNYISVCKILCESFDTTSSNPCQGNQVQLNDYNQCLDNLKPIGSCKGLARPLGYRYGKTSQQKVDLYASKVIDIDDCL